MLLLPEVLLEFGDALDIKRTAYVLSPHRHTHTQIVVGPKKCFIDSR
jgi:hypothetical protein